MPQVTIEDKGCRGCTLCADTCPTQVFDMDQGADLARAARSEDCIGCLSCFYICPSQCIKVEQVHTQRPFYRLEGNVALVEKLLQEKTATRSLTEDDWREAQKDVTSTLLALSTAVVEMMGRANKALGRKAGTLAAAHLPEVYEESGLDAVLAGLKQRFAHCFDFESQPAGDGLDVTFKPCALLEVVSGAGQEAGTAVTCQLFHEYFTGLIGAFTGTNFAYELKATGPDCMLRLEPK